MTEERLILAIGRIERALSRLEAARPGPAHAPASDPSLPARHTALRARTAAAIERIDALLGDASPGPAPTVAPPASALS